MKKPTRFNINWSNNLRFKDEIDPFYYSKTGVREVVSLGKTVKWEIEFDDGSIETG